MNLIDFEITGEIPFLSYLLSDTTVKRILKDFEFYNVRLYRKEGTKDLTVCLTYPQGNMYWFLEFVKIIKKDILDKSGIYTKEWIDVLKRIKLEIQNYYENVDKALKNITQKDVVQYMSLYNLRDYQAYDLLQLKIKMNLNNTVPAGLILSEQRTGKTRIALATALDIVKDNLMLRSMSAVCIIACPKSAVQGWIDEIEEMKSTHPCMRIEYIYIKNLKSLKDNLKESLANPGTISFRIVTYDILKRLSKPQLKDLISIDKAYEVLVIGDECHILRNFKTQQSEAMFLLKETILKYSKEIDFAGIIGITGTPAVKDSYDVFGSLSFVNFSKISLSHTTKDFNEFKEYFYNCEDTSYGKVCKSIKRKAELNYILHSCSVQTKQKDLDLFKNYTKEYRKVLLDMDADQHFIYNEIQENMEYEDLVDCKNSLAKVVRLRQVCDDPSTIIETYTNIAPKLKYLVAFAKKNKIKFIVFSKMLGTLKHLKELFDKNCIKNVLLEGSLNVTERTNNINAFRTDENIQVCIIQQDVGREALTLPEAKAVIFLDRDFAQGYNEQAEARMTPIDGTICTKYVIDLVMKNTIEEDFYELLVVRKESINNVNEIYDKLLGKRKLV